MKPAASLRTQFCSAVASLLVAQTAFAQEPADPPDTNLQPAGASQVADDPWRVELSPYLWALGISGELGVRSQSAFVDATFIKVIEKSDSVLAFAGRLEVGRGKWGGFIDAGYASVGVEGATGPLGLTDIDVEYQQAIVDFCATYRIGEWPAANGSNRVTTLDLYAGGRYTHVDLTVTPALAAERSGSKSWLDPILGLRLAAPLNEHLHIAANADAGGLGVASEFVWSATAVLGYDFELAGHPASLYAGYRVMGWDYRNTTGSGEFTWDIIEHGVTFGFTIQF